MSELTFARAGAKVKPKEERVLSDAAWSILVLCVQELGLVLMQICKRLELHPATMKAAVDELIGKGFAKLHYLPRVGRGARFRVLEILPAADAEITKANLKRPALRLKGSWLHDLYGHFVRRWATQQEAKYLEFEKQVGSKVFDLHWTSREDQNCAGEIICSGGPLQNAQALLTGLENRGISKLYAFFHDGKLLKATVDRLQETDADGLAENRLECRPMGEVIMSVIDSSKGDG
ncbi:hypothetical protein ACFL34_05380 [Candidatus Sumerlaeota bacterium]